MYVLMDITEVMAHMLNLIIAVSQIKLKMIIGQQKEMLIPTQEKKVAREMIV